MARGNRRGSAVAAAHGRLWSKDWLLIVTLARVDRLSCRHNVAELLTRHGGYGLGDGRGCVSSIRTAASIGCRAQVVRWSLGLMGVAVHSSVSAGRVAAPHTGDGMRRCGVVVAAPVLLHTAVRKSG